MRNLYSIFSLIMVLITVSVFGQDRVYAPSLNLPESGEVELAPNVTLDWNAVTGGTLEVLYELQVATEVDFSDATTFPKSDLTSKEMEDLYFGTTYFWRVRAYDGEDVSEWSEEWSFTIASTIELETPNNGTMVYANPKVTWVELTGLLKYQLQIDTSYIWNNVELATTEDIFGSYVVDENDMWLVGDDGLILHYDGSIWNSMDGGTTEALNSVNFVDATHGFIVGDNGTFLSYDGTTWTAMDAGTTENLRAVAFADADNGYAVGDGGVIVKYASGTFSLEVASDGSNEITEDYTGIDVLDANNYWACGSGKIVINYNGTDWTGTEAGTKDHNAIWFTSETDGWVASQSGKINHYDGTEWVEYSTSSKHLYGIAVDGGTAYAVGRDGVMWTFNGSEWEQITSGTTLDLLTIYMADGYGISAGESGVLINKAGEGFNSEWSKVISINADSTNYQFGNLLFGKPFYYRIRGINNNDTSAWSGAKSMISYDYPELDNPSDGASGEQLQVEFEWSEYDGVTRYYIEVSKFEDFSSSLNYITDTVGIIISGFNFSEEYFWRVRAEHPEDISNWTEAFSFTTIDKIELISPENDETGVTRSVRFEWEEVLGAASYEIVIDQNENFTNSEKGFVNDAYYQTISPLDENGVYYWKVRGVAGLDTSSWSNVWSFKVEGPDAIEDLFSEKSVRLYPNPSNGIFNIEINSIDAAECQIIISDMSGKEVYNSYYSAKPGSNVIGINLGDDVSKGIYMINIKRDKISVNKKMFRK